MPWREGNQRITLHQMSHMYEGNDLVLVMVTKLWRSRTKLYEL